MKKSKFAFKKVFSILGLTTIGALSAGSIVGCANPNKNLLNSHSSVLINQPMISADDQAKQPSPTAYTPHWEDMKNHSSNITDGNEGTIFEDSNKTLWAMGHNTPLQFSTDDGKEWTTASQFKKGSGVDGGLSDGAQSTIIEDSKTKTLWAMSKSSHLWKLDLNAWAKNHSTKWIDAKTAGSNIDDGADGSIFADSNGTIWAMGTSTTLQYLDKDMKWKSVPQFNSNNKLMNGENSSIFEDSNHTLWAMGYGSHLWKLDLNAWFKDSKTQWIDVVTPNGSNIKDGYGGSIFEDSNKILWAMGFQTPLQYSIDKGVSWTTVSQFVGHASGTMSDGENGTIFEDSNKTLWAMSSKSHLWKLDLNAWVKKHSTKWIDAKTTGSSIDNGENGTVFEDSHKTLWSMADGSPLQFSVDKGKTWKVIAQFMEGPSSNQSSNVWDKGASGIIFEDKDHNNLWAMRRLTHLWKLNLKADPIIQKMNDKSILQISPKINFPKVDFTKSRSIPVLIDILKKAHINQIKSDNGIITLDDLQLLDDQGYYLIFDETALASPDMMMNPNQQGVEDLANLYSPDEQDTDSTPIKLMNSYDQFITSFKIRGITFTNDPPHPLDGTDGANSNNSSGSGSNNSLLIGLLIGISASIGVLLVATFAVKIMTKTKNKK